MDAHTILDLLDDGFGLVGRTLTGWTHTILDLLDDGFGLHYT